MAIFSCSMGFISRSEGRSSVGFGAYISGSKGYDQRTGVSYDYSHKKEVILTRILAPEGVPAWVLNSDTLWNRVEQFEDQWAANRFRGHPTNDELNKRSLDAREQFLSSTQTAQTIMCALPLELTQEQAESCVEAFLKARFVSRGLVTAYAIHWDKGNPHFHAQICRRALVEGEFSQRKDRKIVTKPELLKTRHMWAEVVNKHLALAGHEVRVDARSLADQGSLFQAAYHEGWHAQRLAERGGYSRIVVDNEAIRQQNIQIMCERPEAIVHEVTLKRTTFTRKHIEDEIIRRVGGDEGLFAILKAKVEGLEIPSELILNQVDSDKVYEGFAADVQGMASQFADKLLSDRGVVHEVGQNLNRQKIYTSVSYQQQEEAILGMTDRLHQKTSKVIADEKIGQGIQILEREKSREQGRDFSFFPEQAAAIRHLCAGGDIRVLNGKAGTGKTTLLKAVAQIYAEEGYRVMGTSFQGKAVEIMEQEIGIPCRTLDSLIHSWARYEEKKAVVEKGGLWGMPYIYAFNRMKELEQSKFTTKDVILVDEANMIGGHLWEPFLKEVSTAGAKVLIIQDPAQIKSRDPGDFGRLFAERYGYAETAQVVRQKVEWQRQCSVLLNDHRVLDGLQPYQERGHVQWFENQSDAHRPLVKDYLTHMRSNPYDTRMALAYTNKEVFELNQWIRSELKDHGLLKGHFIVNGSEYSIGDVIRFTQNDHHERFVKSSNFWTDQNKGVKNGSLGTIMAFDSVRQQLKVSLHGAGERIVKFNVAAYSHFTLGYAMGVHKSEGSTFDKTFVSPDPMMDPSTTLVAMTRHRHDLQVYANHEKFVDFKDLVDQLSYGGVRDTLADYQVSDAQKPFFSRVQNYKDLIAEIGTLREEREAGPSEVYQQLLQQKGEVAKEILADWDNYVPYVRLAGIRRDVLEVDAGVRTRLLSDLEHRASAQAQGYMDLARQTKDLWGKISETHPGGLSMGHELYQDYKDLKSERDFMASVLMENPGLHRPFFKVEKVATETGDVYKDYWGDKLESEQRVSFAGVKAHSEAHYQEHARNTYYDGLTDSQKQDFKLVESYLSARNRTVAIYHELQKEGAVASLEITQGEFTKYQEQRDALALRIISPDVKVQGHFEHLKVDEDKLLDHAIGGQTRELIKAHAELTPQSDLTQESHGLAESKPLNHTPRVELSQQLLKQLDHATSRHLMKESGLDFDRLKFDVGFNKGVQAGRIDPSANPEHVYKPIKDYLEPSREVARIWNMIQTKSDKIQAEPMEIMNQSPLRQEWLQMIQARNESAAALAQNPEAMATMAHMNPGFEAKLYEQISKLPNFEFNSNAGLKMHELCKEASYLGDLMKRLDATKDTDFRERSDLRCQITDRMEALSKTFVPLVMDIKTVNPEVGAKLERELQYELRRELSRDRGRGMEM